MNARDVVVPCAATKRSRTSRSATAESARDNDRVDRESRETKRFAIVFPFPSPIFFFLFFCSSPVFARLSGRRRRAFRQCDSYHVSVIVIGHLLTFTTLPGAGSCKYTPCVLKSLSESNTLSSINFCNIYLLNIVVCQHRFFYKHLHKRCEIQTIDMSVPTCYVLYNEKVSKTSLPLSFFLNNNRPRRLYRYLIRRIALLPDIFTR
jgi:hypothetical protein